MTRGDLARLLALYAAALAGGTAVWIVLFHTPLLAGAVFFYRGLVLLAATTAVVAALLLALRQRRYRGLLGIRDILLIVTLLLSVNVVFFTHLPVTADRSISVYILAYMNRADGPLTAGEISDNVVREYLVARGAIDKRLDEQVVTGTIVRSGDAYVISPEVRGPSARSMYARMYTEIERSAVTGRCVKKTTLTLSSRVTIRRMSRIPRRRR